MPVVYSLERFLSTSPDAHIKNNDTARAYGKIHPLEVISRGSSPEPEACNLHERGLQKQKFASAGCPECTIVTGGVDTLFARHR